MTRAEMCLCGATPDQKGSPSRCQMVCPQCKMSGPERINTASCIDAWNELIRAVLEYRGAPLTWDLKDFGGPRHHPPGGDMIFVGDRPHRGSGVGGPCGEVALGRAEPCVLIDDAPPQTQALVKELSEQVQETRLLTPADVDEAVKEARRKEFLEASRGLSTYQTAKIAGQFFIGVNFTGCRVQGVRYRTTSKNDMAEAYAIGYCGMSKLPIRPGLIEALKNASAPEPKVYSVEYLAERFGDTLDTFIRVGFKDAKSKKWLRKFKLVEYKHGSWNLSTLGIEVARKAGVYGK